jgi:LacI family transcriptional regulator
VVVSSSHSDADETRDVLRAMNGRVDGVVVMSPTVPPRELERSLPAGLPAVFLNAAPGSAARPAVGVDNRGGARAMVAHLLSLGHRRVALVNGPASNADATERRRGCADALRAAGLGPGDVVELAGDFGEESGEAAGEDVARRKPRPSAVFAANDSMAIGVLIALRRAGIRVPEEIVVAGFDDIPVARFASPPLSTVRHDLRNLGERALARLLAEVSGGSASLAAREVLPYRLVLRESTGGDGACADPGPPRSASVSKRIPNGSFVQRRKAS